MRARIVLLVMIVLTLGFLLAASSAADTMMTTQQKEEMYNRALHELEAYFDSEGTSSDLNGIIEVFDDLGGYQYSRMLQYYVQVLQKTMQGNFDYELTLKLEMLEANADFQTYLEQRRAQGSTPIGTVAQLKAYVQGRKAEREGSVEDALSAYRECLSFFDASVRYESLRYGQSENAYEQAMRCLESGDFARAWYILKNISPYRDSADLMKGIENMLGYQPAGPEDNLQPVASIRVTGTGHTEITLAWDPAAHAEAYEVTWRQNGSNQWAPKHTVRGTSITIQDLKRETAYDFSVTAVSGQIKAQSTVIMNRKTAAATPAPTAVVPQQVKDIYVKETGQTEITLAWSPVAYAEKYEVSYRVSGTVNWTNARNTTNTSMTVTGLQPDTAYEFSVVAIAKTERGQRGLLTYTPRTWLEVDDILIFGHYEQDNNTANGKEPIKWIVLDVHGSKVLLLSKYGLDSKPYNTKYVDITWENCTLRSWLNGEFLNIAFSPAEQGSILTTTVDNSKYQYFDSWSTEGGNNTRDKIFLLSCLEANRYFGVTKEDNSNMKSRIAPTAYAHRQGASQSNNNKTEDGVASGWWWLRSSGSFQIYAANVTTDGAFDYHAVIDSFGCVRPAMWIDLNAGFLSR